MIKWIKYITLLLVLFLQTSCFEVLEEINLNNDGSGHFKYTINFSRSKTYIKALLTEEGNDYNIPAENVIKSEILKSANVCKTSQGITNVDTNIDFDNYICIFKCDFTSIKALNNMITNVRISRKDKTENMNPFYAFYKNRNQFNRLNDKVFIDIYQKMKDNEKKILTDADYTCIFRFSSEIESYSNANARLSKNKKAILLKTKILEIINKTKSLKNLIKLKL